MTYVTYFYHIQMSLFFLTKNEEKVFFATSSLGLSVTDIAKKARVGRTSTQKALESLEKMGLVCGKKVRYKNRHLYTKTDDNTINDIVESIRASLLGRSLVKKYGITLSPSCKVNVFKGKNGIIETLERVLSIRVNERIYGTQGPDGVSSWIEYLGKEEILRLHSIIKKNQLIMIGFRAESIKQKFKHEKEVMGSYKGRLSQTHALPDEFLQEKFSLYIFRDTVLFIDLQNEVAVEVADIIVASGLVKLIRFILSKTERDRI